MGYKLKAALKTSLVPEIGPPLAFARNIAAEHIDHEGRSVWVPANCARFTGARFVQNQFTASEDFTDPTFGRVSNGSASVPVVTTGASITYNGTTYNACRAVFALNGGTTINDRAVIQNAISALGNAAASARPRLMSFIIQSNTASSYVMNLRVGSGGSQMITVTPAPQRFSVITPGDGDGTTWLAIRGGLAPTNSDSADVLITASQFEFIDHRVASASELVTNGEFNIDVSGWTTGSPDAVLTWVSGRARLTCNAGGSRGGYGAVPTTPGQLYLLTGIFTTDGQTGNSFLGAGTALGSANLANANMGSTVGTYSVLFRATTSTTYISFSTSSATLAGEFIEMDSLSVKAINEAPSEYVSNGAGLAWPYHGAGADGCQFFDTLNGNTVDPVTHVVTEATGAKIAAATLKTMKKERASQNLLWPSTPDTVNWTTFQVGTPGLPTVTQNVGVAPDGASTATKIVFPAISGSDSSAVRRQVSGLTNPTTLAPSVFLRADAACEIFLRQGNGNQGYQTFQVGTAWQRFTPTPGSNAATFFNFDIAAGVRASGRTVYVWIAQVEPGSTVTSPIATTTAPGTRPEDQDSFTRALIINPSGTVYAEVTPDDSTTGGQRIIGDASGGGLAPLFLYSPTRGGIYDGTTIASSADAPAGTLRLAATWGPNGLRAYANGVPGAATPYDGSIAPTGDVGLGYGQTGFGFQGHIGNVVILDNWLSEFEVPQLPNCEFPRQIGPYPAAVADRPAIGAAVRALAPIACATLQRPTIIGKVN